VHGEHDPGVERHALLLPFDTDHPEFVRGFEAGRIWTSLRLAPDEPLVETVHVDNVEMALRMGEATGRRVQGTEDQDGHWMTLTFDAAHPAA
jgi:hypothetical protein